MRLQFEYGALDKPWATVEGDWFQITYSVIRDENDNEIAHFTDGLWHFEGETYSDIVLSGGTDNG